MNYTEIISLEKVYEVNKQDLNLLPDVSNLPADEADDVINSLHLKRVFRALNTDPETGKVWEPDWNNKNQRKYTIWPEVAASADKPGGFGFVDSRYDDWHADSTAGSRLCLQSADHVKHLYKYFTPLLIKCYLIIK